MKAAGQRKKMVMKVRLRQKHAIANKVADFLKEEGSVLTKVTYSSHPNAPVRYPIIQKFFKTYGGLLAFLEQYRPDAFPSEDSTEDEASSEDPLKALSKNSTIGAA